MVRSFTLILTIFSFSFLNAQTIITSDDMPLPGDTVRRSNTMILEGIDYEQTGPDYNWDFSTLSFSSQQVDTFVSVSETPLILQGFFNNQFLFPDHKATVARKLAEFTSLPGFEVTDTYQFLKNSPESFREVGYGMNFMGLTIPVLYDEIDTLYRFPLVYGLVDSSVSYFEVDLPSIGFASISKKRKNYADGWGTLTTPFGEFQTLRVKTEIEEYDSIYIDSLGTGIPLNRYITEYKWLANGFPLPLLQINEEGFIVTAAYIDTLRSTSTSIYDFDSRYIRFSIYPNPCSDFISINYELTRDSRVEISIHSLYGHELIRINNSEQGKGLYNRVLYLADYSFKPGIYLLRLTVDNVPYVRRILVN
jgi:hypothetical protein